MNIKRQSIFTGEAHEIDLDVTTEQINRWQEGELVQKVFPHLSIEEREFLITGASLAEQAEFFGTDDDDLSVCCGAPFYEDTDICIECKEHG